MTIIDIVRTIIVEQEIHDTLWLEIILVIIHVKNLPPIHVLEGNINPIEI